MTLFSWTHLVHLSLYCLLCLQSWAQPYKTTFSTKKCKADSTIQIHKDIYLLFQLTIYIFSLDATDTNQEVKKPLTGKMQFLPGQTAIHCRLTLEASSPNSHQLQRIYLNKSWAETLLGFCPRKFHFINLYFCNLVDSPERNQHFYSVFSKLNSLNFMQLLMTKCTLRRSALKCLLLLFFLEFVFPFQEHLTALHGLSHFSLNVEIFELVTKIFFAPST